MDVTDATRAELTSRGRASALRVADLVRSLDDRQAAAVVPGLDWTAAETAAHVVNLYGRALGDWRRSESPGATAALNALCLAEYDERDPARLADRIATDAATVWDEVLPSLGDDLELPFHGGVRANIITIMGVVLMEMLVHGDDIARAARCRWAIDDADAWLALRTIAPLLPTWRQAGSARDTIAIPGPASEALRVTCEADRTSVAIGPPEAGDRVTPASPATALLGLLGRRTCDPPLDDLARRFGPF